MEIFSQKQPSIVDENGIEIKSQETKADDAVVRMFEDFDKFQGFIESCDLDDFSDLEAGSVYSLISELGEWAGWEQRINRGDFNDDPIKLKEAELKRSKELGDILVTICMICTSKEIMFGDIAMLAISKLMKRKETNTLKGAGDNREDNN